MDNATIQRLAGELRKSETPSGPAIALDFDGVCKKFTDHKHQIMFSLLFLHLREFQRVPFDVYRKNYIHINFRSADYAGKERFLCVDALARHLAGEGYPCALPGLAKAVAELRAKGLKISEKNLAQYQAEPDVQRALEWSREVNKRVADLSEIGLTPGILKYILQPFRDKAHFYVVSTATEEPLRRSLEKEGIGFIRRYIGQETATKAEALSALAAAGYSAVAMFGDSVEDERASHAARQAAPNGSIVFVPVIPEDEERCFETGGRILRALLAGRIKAAEELSAQLESEFKGREAGSQSLSPMTIRA
ncbi:MAG: hypothetical protein PHW60_06330 [Kiritimatiellae bacterium]|nr:hypothetical protein [Kiritimatiellia bacterium]